MRLRTQFVFLLSACAILSIFVVAGVLSRRFVKDQKIYISDIQSSLVLSAERQLIIRMDLLYTQVGTFLQSGELKDLHKLSKLPGVLSSEVWKEGKRISASDSSIPAVAPPVGRSQWTIFSSPSRDVPLRVRWVGRFNQAFVVMDLAESWFGKMLETSHGTTVELVDHDKRVLLRNSPHSKLHGQELFSNASILDGLLRDKKAHPESHSFSTLDGKKFLGTFLSLSAEPGLFLVVTSPWSAIEKISWRVYQLALWVAAVALVLAVGTGLLFSNRLTRPLEELARQTKKIAEGNFEESFEMNRKDEIGSLVDSFNQMRMDLIDLKENLRRTERLAVFGKFSAVIAHEVKSPLSLILTTLQLLRRRVNAPGKIEPAELDERLHNVESEIFRINDKLINLMKFARQDKVPCFTLDLASRLAKSIEIVQPLLAESKIVLETNVPTYPVYSKADGDQIHEVFLNLINNAINALESTPNKWLSIQMTANGDEVSISIEDNGKGIPVSIQNRIFDPFFTTKEIGKGTGLGLAVVHGIISNHEGKISVESEEGKFTRFTIALPQEKALEAAS